MLHGHALAGCFVCPMHGPAKRAMRTVFSQAWVGVLIHALTRQLDVLVRRIPGLPVRVRYTIHHGELLGLGQQAHLIVGHAESPLAAR